MDTMKFCEHLTYYRERARMTKTALAEKVGVTPPYIMDIESGKKKPPSIIRVNEMARALSLSTNERQSFVDAAMEERISQDALEWIHGKEQRLAEQTAPYLNKEIVNALQDPAAVKALLAVSKNKKALKKAIRDFLKNHDCDMDVGKQAEILQLCK